MFGLFRLLTGDWSAYGVVAKLAFLAQIALIVHVLRTGRPLWWIWILLIAPLLGGPAYLLVEVLPGLRLAGAGGSGSFLRTRAGTIRDLRRRLEERDTVALRLALAGALLENGDAAEADTVASAALSGPFRDDPHTLAAVARFKLEHQDYPAARALLDRVDTKADRMLQVQKDLLLGRTALGQGDFAAAEAALQRTEGRHLGDEPRFWLARVYLATGRRDAGLTVLRDIRTRFRRSNRIWRRTEERWFKAATALLKDAEAGPAA